MKTTNQPPPRVEGAPGLTWRPRANGRWEARWQCRTDLVSKGYETSTARLGVYSEPLSEFDRLFIVDNCRRMQDHMLAWAHGGQDYHTGYDGSMRGLIAAYQKDPDSRYNKVRFATRQNYTAQCKALLLSQPDAMIADIKPRIVTRWHEEWAEKGIARAHGMISMLRMILSFGAAMLECEDCLRAGTLLAKTKFQMGAPRNEVVTAEQAIAIRAKAHELEIPMIALAQAFQFECTLRQKDVIGEWVPLAEPGISQVIDHRYGLKWLRGIQWQEIDSDLILRHVTSKKNKAIEVNLRLAPMVLEELERLAGGEVARDALPASGPVILNRLGEPYRSYNFRRHWRKIADAAGVPKSIKNMDSRAGAITEATDSGATLEDVRHAATHSNVSMTQRYSRNQAKKTAAVMELRVRNRSKPGT